MRQNFEKVNKACGTVSLRGDKSISHRSLMISSLSKGRSHINNLSSADDVISTIRCLRELGVDISSTKNQIIVKGKGYKGFKKSNNNLNAGNSGTTARLLSGILAVQDFGSVIEGDDYLSIRPMLRIIEPLKMMGAEISGSRKNTLPLTIKPSEKLCAIKYSLNIASAQVKSAVLFAGLHLDDTTEVVESIPSRNHTENLLNLDVRKSYSQIISRVSRKNYPDAEEYFIPGDISSAMYFIVLALLTKNSELFLKNIALNKTRTASIELLQRMGAKIDVELLGESHRESYGNLIVRYSKLTNVALEKEIIPLIIDEIPILSVAGLFAEGDFEVKYAQELRVKESDRIKSLHHNFSCLGCNIVEYKDGFLISGNIKNSNPVFESFNDHRIAMTFSILSCLLSGGGSVEGIESVNVSNPNFLSHLKKITR